MYQPRASSDLTPIAQHLTVAGIAGVADVYSPAELALFNSQMDRVFSKSSDQARSYVRPDDMLTLGIFERIFSRRMRDLIFSVVPDPVLYHLHAYEIAGSNSQSHIFSDQTGGWHRDPDSQFHGGDPTHVSIFVYLSDVGDQDGAFQFAPYRPDKPLRSDSPVLSMLGEAGTSFIWHRSFYHRAAPNRGPNRRRVLKISVQPNDFFSAHLSEPFFSDVRKLVERGDEEIDVLLGRYQGTAAPRYVPSAPAKAFHLAAKHTIDLPKDALKRMRRKESAEAGKPVAYD